MLKKTNLTVFLASVFTLQIASLGLTSDAEAQDPSPEFELVTEIVNFQQSLLTFGAAVSFVGNDLIVGSQITFDVPCVHDGVNSIGKIFGCSVVGEVTLFDSTTGQEIRKIQNPSPDVLDQRICGDDVIVDAGLQGSCVINQGIGFVYDAFGAAIASFGDDKFVVGAPSDNTFGCSTPYACDTGLVYVYGANGGLLRTLKAPAPGSRDRFGSSVASIGNNILVGAIRADNFNGAVYMFDGTTGALLLELNNPDPQTTTRFGTSVAGLGDDVIVVGSPGFDNSSTVFEVGRVYLFDANTGALKQRILSPISTTRLHFGQSVIALGEDELAVTAPGFSDPGTQFSGRVFLYDKEGNPAGQISDPEPTSFGRFGCQSGNCVGRIGENLLIGGKALFIFGDSEVKLFTNPDPADQCFFGHPLAVRGVKFAVADVCDRNTIEAPPAPDGSPFPAPRGSVFVYSSEPRLEGSVKLFLKLFLDEELPLKRVQVELLDDLTVVESTVTDDMGEYAIDIPEGVVTGRLRISLEDKKAGAGQLTVGDSDTSGETFVAAYLEIGIDLENETRGDVVFNATETSEGVGGIKLNGKTEDFAVHNVTDVDSFLDLAAIYLHTINFLDWSEDKLATDLFTQHLEVGLLVCPDDGASSFNSQRKRISMCRENSVTGGVSGISNRLLINGFDSRDIQIFILGHEFGHFIEHQSVIGGVGSLGSLPAGNVNHDGYKNPDSSDSVSEGFAHFMSAVMRFELYGTPPTIGPLATWPFLNLDENIFVHGVLPSAPVTGCGLEYLHTAEEFAVATLLWDLYDATNESFSGDDITLTIGQIWSIITNPALNILNPEIISTFDDLRLVLTNGGLNVFELFVARLAFLDLNENCVIDGSEPVGKTQWLVRDSETGVPIVHDLPRPGGFYDPRQNMSLEVFHPETGDPLTNFAVFMSIEFEPPNDIFNFDGADFVKSSPYIFNASLFHPATLKITISKEGLEPETVEMTFDEFWDAYTSAPADVGDALITKVVNGNGQTVSIDIKPGSDPNCFNVNGHGVIPVAILGTEDFDVNGIDVESLSLGGLEVRMRGKKGSLCSPENSNQDPFLDLVCHFEDNPDNWIPGNGEATLTGQLLDGTSIEGTDSICIVP